MDFAFATGELELRQAGDVRVLAGTFPYGRIATVRDRGRTRKERIDSRAFDFQLTRFREVSEALQDIQDQVRRELLEEQLERANVHVLSGHDFAKPLGDLRRGTARIESTPAALTFEVDLPAEIDMPTYMLDAVKEIRTGRAGGVSPGFRVPPRSVVPDAEALIPEPGNPGTLMRVIREAVLHEISVVSRPAYGSTELAFRAEDMGRTDTSRGIPLWL